MSETDEVAALRAERDALQAKLDAVRRALTAPIDTKQVLDNHWGRSLWKAGCNTDALAILDEEENA